MSDDSDAAVLEVPLNSGESSAGVENPVSDAGVTELAELDLGYQVTLDHFSGPMDLLLYLVRRSEIDITDIPIGYIADQFIAMLNATPDMDLDVAGDFILMAATLLELKSRLVVPPPEVEVDGSAERDDEIIDPRAGLVRQLLTYRRFKEATQLLPVLELEHEQRHERRFHEIIPEDSEEIDGLDLTNCDVGLLYDNFETILVRINRLEPRTVLNDDVPLEHKINGMIDIMRSSRESTLKKFFALETTVSGRVGVVMATLECARQRFIEAKQFEQYGEVILRYREDQERTIDAGELPPEPVEDGKKRRKRIPLVTWHPPERSNEPEQQEIDLPDLEEEVVIESDEQKFLRELEETCAVDAVLTRIADLDAGFLAFQAEQQAAAEAAAKAAEVAAAAELIAAQNPVAVVESPVALETSAPAQSANEPISKRPKRRCSPPAPKERQNERKNVQFHGTISNDDTDDDFFEDSPLDAATNDENPPETPPTDAS